MPNKVLRTGEDTEVFCPRQFIQNGKPSGYFLLDEDKNMDGAFVTLKQYFDFPQPIWEEPRKNK